MAPLCSPFPGAPLRCRSGSEVRVKKRHFAAKKDAYRAAVRILSSVSTYQVANEQARDEMVEALLEGYAAWKEAEFR